MGRMLNTFRSCTPHLTEAVQQCVMMLIGNIFLMLHHINVHIFKELFLCIIMIIDDIHVHPNLALFLVL